MSSQIICYISDLNKPSILPEVAKEELTEMDIDEEQVQIIKMIDQNRKMAKKIKPILIKRELDREHDTKLPFDKHPGEIEFTNAERVPLRTEPLLDYYKEVTDDEEYKENDEVISIESDSSTADSMLDEDFEVTDPLKFDASLMKLSNGLKHAAEGFEELRQMFPSVPVTDLPKLTEETLLPYLTPLSKEMVQALQSVGEERMVELALHEEHSKGANDDE